MTTKALGENGFRWFIGVVVDRKSDPQKLGRVRVRVYGVHDDIANTPDDQLPWATIVNPPQSASANQVGIAPLGIVEGAVVVGFFADGREAQLPMILGTIAGIPDNDVTKHDVAKLAREENDLVKETVGTEPPSAYAAKYPYNKVVRTESGHVFEVDDTPGAERLHDYHRSGTYTEIDKDGRKVDKIVGDGYEVIVKDKHVYVQGAQFVDIVGSSIINVKGHASFVVDGECLFQSKGAMTIESDKRLTLRAPEIHWNPEETSDTSHASVTANQPPKVRYAGFVQPNLTTYRFGL